MKKTGVQKSRETVPLSSCHSPRVSHTTASTSLVAYPISSSLQAKIRPVSPRFLASDIFPLPEIFVNSATTMFFRKRLAVSWSAVGRILNSMTASICE
jgi:hypothetical protein